MNEYINNRQIAFIIFGTIVGYGVIGLPKDIAENAGTGGWFSLLIATFIAILFTYIITYLSYIFEKKTICEYSKILTNKYISKLFIMIYVIYFFLIFSMLTRITSEVINRNILQRTPTWVMSLFFLLIVYYTLLKKLKVIARICEIYGLIVIIGSLFLSIVRFYKGQLVNITPLLTSAEILRYLKAITKLVIPFLGIEIITIIPFNRKINDKNVFKYTTIIVFIIGIMYILEVESCISVMGVESIVHYKDSALATIRRIEMPFLEFFRRLDSIFLVAWIMATYSTVSIFSYGVVCILSRCSTRIDYNWLVFITMSLGFVATIIPKTVLNVESMLMVAGYLGLITACFIPAILFIIAKIRGYDKNLL